MSACTLVPSYYSSVRCVGETSTQSRCAACGARCEKCQALLPHLLDWYGKIKAAGAVDVEVVYVSGDRTPEAFAGTP